MDGSVRLLIGAARAREPANAAGNASVGQIRIFKDGGSGQVDASSEIIGRIGANITELDSV